MSAAGWADLERELDAWGTAGRVATFWWRDDDAAEPTAALDRLLEAASGAPVALAVVPGKAVPALAARLGSAPAVSVLQHGWMHVNHAPKGERAAELGAHRPLDAVMAELAAGWRALQRLFGRRALAVMTPPWNRIAESVAHRLAGAGYAGLSTSGPRRRPFRPGLVEVNAHVDVVDWKARQFVGPGEALRRIVRHLGERRQGAVDAAEPTGILTHHLVMEAESERFLARLAALVAGHAAARWVGAAEAFAPALSPAGSAA